MALLLSFPERWEIRFGDIVSRSASGRDATTSALKKLIACGYVHRVQQRQDNGRFWAWQYLVYETPEDAAAGLPLPENPLSDKPLSDKPQLNISNIKDKDLKGKDLNFILAEKFRASLLAIKPDVKLPQDLTKWADTFRLLIERDNRQPAVIERIITWAHNDPFWRSNILSPAALRKNFDRLDIQSIQSQRPTATAGVARNKNTSSTGMDAVRAVLAELEG